MYQMKNKSVITASHNSAVLLPTSGNRARNTLFQLAANHVSSPSAQLQHRLWSGIAVTIVTIAATRSSCHHSVPVPATSAHYPLVRGTRRGVDARRGHGDAVCCSRIASRHGWLWGSRCRTTGDMDCV